MGGGSGGVSEELLTTKGDTHGYTTENARVAIGTNTQVLTADSTEALGLKWADSAGAPTTTKGDVSGFSTTSTRIPIGTNTQVLTADSTEALGLKWATPDTPPTTTKGDLSGFSTVQGRFPVGSDGQTLVADSTQPFGLRWESPSFSSTYGDSELKSYWKFDESSGDIINQSVSADTLGTAADLQTSGVTYSEAGIIDESVLYDGVNDTSIAGSSVSQFNFIRNTTATSTIVIWYKQTALDGDNSFLTQVCNGAGGQVGMQLQKRDITTNKRTLSINNYNGSSAVNIDSSDTFFPADLDWHMLSLRLNYAASTITCQIDVQTPEVLPIVQTWTNTNSCSAMKIGYWATSQFYGGNLDEFSIWNKLLTDAEIISLYNGGSGLGIY